MAIKAAYGCISFNDEYTITRTQLLRAIAVAMRADIITCADIEQQHSTPEAAEQGSTMSNDYLDTQRAAEALGITARQVRRHCAEGRLGERIGPTWQVTPEDLELFKGIDRPVGYHGRAAKQAAMEKRNKTQ